MTADLPGAGRGLAGVLLADLPRRRVLRIGAATVAGAAVVAACDHSTPKTLGAGRSAASTTTSSSSTTTTLSVGAADDILVLRTASSIEHYAAGIYTQAVGLDVIKTAAVTQAIELFAGQHSEHASAFESATVRAGGTAFSEPNPVLSRAAVGQIHQLRSEADVLRFLYGVENLTTATYTAAVGTFEDPGLNTLMTSVGAVDARHLAVLGMMLVGVPPPPGATAVPYPGSGFQPVTGAVTPGLGLDR